VKEYKNKIKNLPNQLNMDWNKPSNMNFGNKEELDKMTEMTNKMMRDLFTKK
jgi:hypothetical protein